MLSPDMVISPGPSRRAREEQRFPGRPLLHTRGRGKAGVWERTCELPGGSRKG